jgi:hypothetical protein
MRILALIGPTSCGKTTTLDIVYDHILQHGGISTHRQQQGGNPRDFSDIMNWNNQSIAFFTMGDYSSKLIQAINDFNNQHCDILICACNIRFMKPPRLIATFQHVIFAKNPEVNPQLRSSADNQAARNILNNI